LEPAIDDIENDQAVPGCLQERGEGTDGRELSAPIDGEHAVDQLVVQRFEIGVRHGLGEAGGVDQDIQATEAPLDLAA
jgi:hypothetical protein